MAASYPSAVKVFGSKATSDTIQASHVNDLQDEVNAIEAGLLNGTATLTSSNASVVNLSVSGNSTFGSTMVIGTNTYIFSTVVAASTGLVLTAQTKSGSTITVGWQAAGNQVTLLKQNSGTDASAGATTVDSYAMASGLTAKDTLWVVVVADTLTQQTANVELYHVTDAINVLDLSQGVLAAGRGILSDVKIMQAQDASTHVIAAGTSRKFNAAGDASGANNPACATAWTGNWSLGLRHDGVTAGGSFRWKWSIYKVAGQ